MDLSKLQPFFENDQMNTNGDPAEIKSLYDQFVADFITEPFKVNGKKIRIDSKLSKIAEFNRYSETFVHLITRTISAERRRLFECTRANRIGWIKPILQSHPSKQVLYFKWKDADNVCKEHYWAYSRDYMIVTKEIRPDVQVVTAFCIDKRMKEVFYERYMNFRDGRGNCEDENNGQKKTHSVSA